MRHFLTLIAGILFGTGISMSGMANPMKVINFFDVTGAWDPSLAFVMGGAVLVSFFGFRFALGRETPVFEPAFDLPQKQTIDARLIGGSAIFGIGWGMAGFCPGGALPVLGTLNRDVLLFSVALIAGMLAARAALVLLDTRQPA